MRLKEILKTMEELLYKRYLYKKAKRISKSSEIRNFQLNDKEKNKIKNYWKYYRSIYNLKWHKAYKATYLGKNKKYDYEKFIPEDVFYTEIEPVLNNMELAKAYEDKNIYHKIFDNDKMPKVIIRNMHGNYYNQEYNRLSTEESNNILKEYNASYIIKPSLDTQKGRNVNRITIKDKKILLSDRTYEDLNDLEDIYGSDFLIQEELRQHSLLSSIYKYSLNTIRIITYRDKG